MNDPNGMVYHEGVYHLFYQYYPEKTVWGPMHWGHAVSEDLIKWEHKPIALYPDELGYIFSGSAVVDKNNTSGFGNDGIAPLVAIYTYHDPVGEKEGTNTYETQGIAYSLDNGDTWTKYEGNPVLDNQGNKDFRDPKVMWHDPTESWIMTLVAGDRAQFYRSKDLKTWQFLSEFGNDKGAHGGVWECPDLFQVEVEGSNEKKWVLLISVNPGAPNGGSGTQYFVGRFDGETFVTDQSETLWVDWGSDNYAGVTYSNLPNDAAIFIGWMSNWAYALHTPTKKWRSAMTLPRKLILVEQDEGLRLQSYPVKQFEKLTSDSQVTLPELVLKKDEVHTINNLNLGQAQIKFNVDSPNFSIKLVNEVGEELQFSYTKDRVFELNRSVSGKVDFKESFADRVQQLPVEGWPDGDAEVRLIIDSSSVEIFIDRGRYVMTSQIFPTRYYSTLQIATWVMLI